MKKLYLILLLAIPALLTAQEQPTDSVVLKVAVKQSPPFVFEDEAGMNGISVKLWEQIAAQNGWNYEYEMMSLQEVLNAVATGEADVSINPLTVTSERVKQVKFTQPFFNSNLAVVAKVGRTSTALGLVKRLFSLDFLKAVFVLFLVILVFGFFVWVFERKENAEEFGGGITGIGQGIWWSAVTMTTVGYGDKSPRTLGGRIVALIWMFAAIIMISSFTASIASSLTVDQISTDISQLSDLRDLSIGTVVNSSSEDFFNRNYIPYTGFETVRDGLEAVDTGEIDGFVYDEPIMRYDLQQYAAFSDLQVLPYKFNTQYYSFATTPKAGLADTINPVLLQVIEDVNWKGVLQEYNLTDY